MELCAWLSSPMDQPRWVLAVFAIGFLSLFKTSIAALYWIFVSFIRPGKKLTRYGSCAVITGATDGTGLALAFQFARCGLNLVLVGRSSDKLRNVFAAIMEKNDNVQIETVLIDFAGDLVEGVGRLKKTIEGMDVGILANNAGISYPYAKYFHEVDEALIENLIKVNVEGVTRVAHAVLPGMLERKRGAILNIGSGVATVLPSEPLYAVYQIVPLYVATKMSSIRRSSFFVPSADTFARAILDWIGYEPICTPYWPHSLVWTLISLLPVGPVDKWRLSFCKNIRKRGMLKESRKQN